MTNKLYFTARAAQDLKSILEYSKKTWGKKTAAEYIKSMGDAISRIKIEPKLLKSKNHYSKYFKFYRNQKHLMIFDVFDKSIFLLSVLHINMDIENIIDDLEPTLMNEAKIMSEAISRTKKKHAK